MRIIVGIVIAVIGAIVAGRIAARTGRNPALWSLLGALFPFISAVYLLIAPRADGTDSAPSVDGQADPSGRAAGSPPAGAIASPPAEPVATGPVPGPQSVVSGLVLMAVAAFALWLTSDLSQGTLRAMGPAMLPRWLAIGVGSCGLVLLIIGLIHRGSPLEGITFRGPIVVVIAILCFAATIRGLALGSLAVPQLGLIGAGPLAIFIAGFATPEARARELAILALALTAFCMVLFGDLLNLPIPLFPQWLADLYPVGWSSDARLRATAGLMALGAALILIATRGVRTPATIDVADHSSVPGERGRI